MIDRGAFEAALKAYGEAEFECGEWDKNESDESYDSVFARAVVAEARLWEVVGLMPRPAAPTVRSNTGKNAYRAYLLLAGHWKRVGAYSTEQQAIEAVADGFHKGATSWAIKRPGE